MIPFAEWMPDQADLNNPGATVATNVLPHAMGYVPWPSPAAYSGALSARAQGGVFSRDKTGVTYTFAGDATSLQEMENDQTWTDVTNVGGAYTTGADEQWRFAVWNETVIATNFSDAPQVITMGGANFADLAGSPPKARYIATARNFVILGNIDNSGTLIPNRVWWSGLNDSTTWAQSAVTQADYEDIKGVGKVQQIFGGEYAVVLMERAIYRMTYVGTPVIWQFDEIAPGIGLMGPGMAAQEGDRIYFLSPRGFFSLTNGSQLTAIGANKIDQFVLNDIDTNNLDRCSATVDNVTHRVYFAYPGANNVDGLCNKIVVYDPTLDRWSYSEQSTQVFLLSSTAGYTLETLDNYNSDLDAIDISLDDPIWTGGRRQIAKFDEDNKVSFFTGSPMSATLETSEMQLTPERRTLLTSVRPVVDGGSATIQVASRDIQSLTQEWTMAATPNANGRANIRKNARYHRVRANITGTWTHAQGVEPEGVPAGWR